MTFSTVLCVPRESRLRHDAPLGQLRLGLARALIAQVTDVRQWRELALLTDTESVINGHNRLLSALSFGDEDYDAAVFQVIDDVLGLRLEGEPSQHWGPGASRRVFLDNLQVLEEHLHLSAWLAEHEPRLHRLLYYRRPLAEQAALDAAATVALSLPEIRRQLERLHRDLGSDLPAAVGQAKDLVDSACKAVLGHEGPGAGARTSVLVDAALRALGRHPAQVDPGDPDAQLLRQLLGATTSQLYAVTGLRNRVGTGHGRTGDVALDEPLARLTIGQALAAVT